MALIDDTVLLWTPQAGLKIREDGILKYVRTGYDMSPESSAPLFPSNDLDGSETASQQPRLVGGIAPNSKPAASNQNGESRFFTHTPISFAAGDAWSVTFVIKSFGLDKIRQYVLGTRSTDINNKIRISNDNTIWLHSSGGVETTVCENFTSNKNIVITIVSEGGNTISYVNGALNMTVATIPTDIIFSHVFSDRTSLSFPFYGSISAYIIQSTALTPTQVASLHTTLRGLYPEIESVDIGGKTVASRNFEAVASSDGTVIADGNTTANWTLGTAAWCYHNGATPDTPNFDNGAIYGKLYNKAARDVIVANPPSGWHVATEAELTALAVSGGNALKYGGTDYWATTGGTNTTGFTALGGSSRNADGSFNTIKETASFWCADSDKVLLLNHDDNTATIVAATANQGHSIRLIKD